MDVRGKVELTGRVEALDGGGAALRVIALLDEQGAKPGFGEGQGGKQPRAPGPDDDGAAARGIVAGRRAREAEHGLIRVDGPHAPGFPGGDT